MKVTNLLASVVQKLGHVAEGAGQAAHTAKVPMGAAILAGGMLFSGSASAATIFEEDFDSLTLDLGNNPNYTDSFSTGGNPWTRDNSGMLDTSTNPAYDGGTVMSVASWSGQQGGQGRNATAQLSGNALVFDGDAWDDFNPGGFIAQGFNSFWETPTIDLTGFDASTLEVNFDYEFRAYQSQEGVVDISFDDGATWQNLLDLTVGLAGGDSNYLNGPVSFEEGVDFNATSDSAILRFGKINADNDWWFAVDNIQVTADAIATDDPNRVPEPSSLAIAALVGGIGLLGVRKLRRQNNKKS